MVPFLIGNENTLCKVILGSRVIMFSTADHRHYIRSFHCIGKYSGVNNGEKCLFMMPNKR